MKARLSDLPPLEQAALLNLHAWAPDPDAYGWHVNEQEALNGSDMTLAQFRSALTRLRRKGLVEVSEWHPGQGNGAAREWLWFLTERGRDLASRRGGAVESAPKPWAPVMDRDDAHRDPVAEVKTTRGGSQCSSG